MITWSKFIHQMSSLGTLQFQYITKILLPSNFFRNTGVACTHNRRELPDEDVRGQYNLGRLEGRRDGTFCLEPIQRRPAITLPTASGGGREAKCVSALVGEIVLSGRPHLSVAEPKYLIPGGTWLDLFHNPPEAWRQCSSGADRAPPSPLHRWRGWRAQVVDFDLLHVSVLHKHAINSRVPVFMILDEKIE